MVERLADKSTSSSLLENFRFPKLSLVSKTVGSEQDRAGYSSTSWVPPPLSSEFKFPAKLLVYQRRPKVLLPSQQAESSSMPNQQAEPSSMSNQQAESLSCFSQTSNSPDDVSQLSTTSLSGFGSQVSDLLDDSSDKLTKTQECSARESREFSISQGASE
ncbi:hypothetical protein V6N11_070932, partial [Hibiscus sabdariffa]